MDLLVRHEIYIPEDAEVKSIPLSSLPNSVLKQMGLSGSDPDGSRRLTDSAVGVWICPAVLRQKGLKRTSNQGNPQLESMSSKIAKEFRGSPGPFKVSFVSSNKAAHEALNEALHGDTLTPRPPALPPGLAPKTYQVAVIIYQGCVYLSIRERGRCKCPGETKDPQPASKAAILSPQPASKAAIPSAQLASKAAIPSASDASSNIQKKRPAPQASLKPLKKRLRITLTPRSKFPRNPVKTPNTTTTTTTTTEQPLNGNTTDRNLINSKAAHSEHRKDVTHSRRGGSSPPTAPSVPQSTDGAHRPDNPEADEKQRAADTADRVQQETPSDSETQEPGSDRAQSSSQNNNTDVEIELGSQRLSWRESQGASAPLLLQECDFKELAQEEEIAIAKARLLQSEAALKNLNSSK
ncbi:uncharacterized protein si:dkeyp-110g5.4 isoform X2 [Labrus bergylta]|uniref:uncharacterized protein si:dkeyp-110g5.4 isoform X2 n=1 Tax=Labrus bergylta TaxID=56723 RepID=UPI0010FB1E4F|nr:uncharacterized protein LOC109981545 isoform X2 [Labrus bergylta]